MDGFKPGEECAACKGRCCRERGCSLSPSDIGLKPAMAADKIKLTEMIEKLLIPGEGFWCLDFFTVRGMPFYYLRVRHKCYTFISVEALGECKALTGQGCLFSEESRPKGGRYLQSSPNGHCVQHYTAGQMQEDWQPYQEALSAIWERYYPQFLADGTFEECDKAYFAFLKNKRIQS